jgi:DNA polymerase
VEDANVTLHIDFETRSPVDLTTAGEYNYWADPRTEITLVGWALGDTEPELWRPLVEPVPAKLRQYAAGGGQVAAHNARFERLGWNSALCEQFPGLHPIALHRWICTAAMARANALPGSLGDCARALGVAQQKGHRGAELIRLLSIPREDGTYNEDPALYAEFAAYCLQDVRTERAIMGAMRHLTEEELADYRVNERICDRGVMVDGELCLAATRYAKAEEAELLAEIQYLTEGAVTAVRGEGLKKWVVARLPADAVEAITDKAGKVSMDKRAREVLLDWEGDIDPTVRDVIECSDLAQASSVAKFLTLARRADPEDGRVRGAFILNGAGQTGRFSSTGVQVHNIPRDAARDAEALRAVMVQGLPIAPPVMKTLRSMLRPALMAPEGGILVGADWSAIEGRVLPWLSGEPTADAKLELYRRGVDTYLVAASNIYGERVDDPEDPRRHIGKVAELSLGFGGGAGAFLSMARNYAVVVPAHEAERIKHAWRIANPWAKRFWDALERAAGDAVRNPGAEYAAGRVTYLSDGWWLWCLLPCGRLLAYPHAKVSYEEGPFGEQRVISCAKSSRKPKAGATDWPRMKLWGGLLSENVTQATAASLLRRALRALDDGSEAWEVVMHVHDEIVLESDLEAADAAEARLMEVMLEVPPWANGLPLAAKPWRSKRFKK